MKYGETGAGRSKIENCLLIVTMEYQQPTINYLKIKQINASTNKPKKLCVVVTA